MSLINRIGRDLALSFSFLTRLPVRFPASAKDIKLAEAGWSFPVVGLVIALIAGSVHWLQTWGMPTIIVATLAVLLVVLLTGALHEDGIADSADGMGGGSTVERKLEIMRDSSVGTYGVIAVCFSLIARIGLITAILNLDNSPGTYGILILTLVFSRAMILIAMSAPGELKTGGKGLGAAAGTTEAWMVVPWIAALATANFWLANLSFIMILSVIAPLGFFLYAKEKLGGMTGDIYGAIEQIAQVSFLACLLWYLS